MNVLDKRWVNRSFAAAAKQYDQFAELQRQVGSQLIERFPPSAIQGLDLGAGTGFLTKQLALSQPDAEWIALDLALPMLHVARENLKALHNLHYLCADAEALPLRDESVGQIYSNLALQWCEHLAVLFADCRRVLKPGGQLVFSSFGPDTLKELKTAWSQVDDYAHVNEFKSADAIVAALSQAGFKEIQFETTVFETAYPTVMHLMRELKGLGAHHVNSGRKRGPTTSQQLQAMIAAYQELTGDSVLATYEVFKVGAR